MLLIHGQNGVVYIDVDKEEEFANSLELHCISNFDEDLASDHMERIEASIRRRLRQDMGTPIIPASMTELKRLLKISW